MTYSLLQPAQPPLQTPDIYGVAEFSEDMVETLQTYFDLYKREGVIRIEVSSDGLWLLNPHSGGRQFLGLARMPGRSGHHA